MKITLTTYRRFAIAMLAVILTLVTVIWFLAWDSTYVQWDSQSARIAVKRIDRLRGKALDANPTEAVVYLREICSYQSRSKWHKPQLPFADWVERERAVAVREIIASLRQKTRDDLGDQPEKWINKYATGGLQ